MKFTSSVFTTLLLFSLNSFAFGAPDLLPAKERTKNYSYTTKLDKKKSFQKLSVWAAKTFSNANEAIKLKDADAGVFVVKGNISCDALKLGSGYAKDQRVDFTMEIEVENKKAEIKISDIIGHAEAYDDGARPSKKEELETVLKDCIDPYVELIKAELN